MVYTERLVHMQPVYILMME